MRAISLWQPWASAIATGAKRIETRSWAPPLALVGQVIAIHAAKKDPFKILSPDDYTDDQIRDLLFSSGCADLSPADLPLGVIVATARLSGYRRTESFSPEALGVRRVFDTNPYTGEPIGATEGELGNYAPDRYGWMLESVCRLAEPVPCRGAQGFFILPPDVEAAVRGSVIR